MNHSPKSAALVGWMTLKMLISQTARDGDVCETSVSDTGDDGRSLLLALASTALS